MTSAPTIWQRLKTDKALQQRLFWILIIFLIVDFCLLLIDQTTKAFIFNGDKSGAVGPVLANWVVIGFRSQFHNSTTFLDFIGANLPHWASLLINYIVLLLFSTMLVMAPSKCIAAALSVVIAGIIGNTFDASWIGGVRNVVFVPWSDHGTFNFADLFIVVGAPFTVIAYIISFLKKKK